MTVRLHNYTEVRAYLEKEHPDWLRALTPRHINAPADYWPQKVLAISSVNAAMQNYVSVHEHQTRPNPALAAVHGQAALLLRYDVPTYYVSRELLVAALRTELPDEMVFEAISVPLRRLGLYAAEGNRASSSRRRLPLPCSVTNLQRTASIPADLGAGLWGCGRPGRRARDPYMPEAEFTLAPTKSGVVAL